jgi:hypothetical protein
MHAASLMERELVTDSLLRLAFHGLWHSGSLNSTLDLASRDQKSNAEPTAQRNISASDVPTQQKALDSTRKHGQWRRSLISYISRSDG